MAKKKNTAPEAPPSGGADENDAAQDNAPASGETDGGAVTAELVEEHIAKVMATLPENAEIRRTSSGWRIVRGAQHSEGTTLARARQMLGAVRGPHPENPQHLVWLSEGGDVIPDA